MWSLSLIKHPGVESSLQTLMKCMEYYEIKSFIYKEFTEANKCMHADGML